MKPFNLEEALAGKPVVTRDGREVTQFKLFECVDDYPLAGVMDNTSLHRWKMNGEYSTSLKHHHHNLFMKSETKKVWIVAVMMKGGGIITNNYSSEKEMNNHMREVGLYGNQFKIIHKQEIEFEV